HPDARPRRQPAGPEVALVDTVHPLVVFVEAREEHARRDDVLEPEPEARQDARQVLHRLARLGLDPLGQRRAVVAWVVRDLARQEHPALDLHRMAVRGDRLRRAGEHVEQRGRGRPPRSRLALGNGAGRGKRATDGRLLVDGLIILFYFVAIPAIELYAGRREKSLSDYARGRRRVPWWAAMACIIAAETSAATFLGAAVEGYTNKSFAYVQLVLGLIIGRVIVGNVFLKPYYTFKVYTVYDYLGVRFGPWTKGYVSALFLFMRTLAS